MCLGPPLAAGAPRLRAEPATRGPYRGFAFPSPGAIAAPAGRAYRRVVLIGRDEEQARLLGVLDRACRGQGSAALLAGEPGIGKTALLDALALAADDCHVLRARGVQAEGQLGYAGFARLLAPVRKTLDRLRGPQAEALRAGLFPASAAQTDLYLAYGGVLQVLTALAQERTVLCLIDDLQWLDSVTAEGLLFLARRLGEERIAMVLATRTEDGEHGLETIALHGLGDEDARWLLAETGAVLQPAAAAGVIAASHGNPLALREIPRQLTAEQRSGARPLDAPLPVGPAVERAFLSRARRLSEPARRVLLITAVSMAPRVDVITAAAGDDGGGLDEAEAAGLLVLEDDEVVFRHPLVRSAVFAAATSGQRRAAHRSLGRVLRGDPEDRDLWHRAASSLGPDAELAAALDAAADRARLRCLIDEHMLRERAARLSANAGERAQRLHRAALAAHGGGRSRRAMTLIEEGLEVARDPTVEADLLDARLAIADDLGTVHGHLQSALRHAGTVEPLDADRAERLRARAWLDALERFELGPAHRLARLVTTGHTPEALAATARHGLLDLDGQTAALAAARQGAAAALEGDAASPISAIFAEALMVLGHDDDARRLLEHITDRAAARGVSVELVRGLCVASELELRCGYLAPARVLAERAVEVAEADDIAHCVIRALAARAAVHAVLGDPACGETVKLVLQGAAASADRWSEMRAYDALGRHALGRGDTTAAVAALEQVERTVPGDAHPNLLRWRPDLIEAYVRLERHADAAVIQGRLERQAARSPTAWGDAAVARGRALLADRDASDGRFSEAAALAVRVSQFDLARVELEHGAALRRARHRGRAAAHLQAAAAIFGRLGAADWAERAADDLRACGVTAREGSVALVRDLTSRELEVAMLAAAGETNREIGARLFMSAKTVEVHLGRVYRKLGVRSRTELARIDGLAEVDPVRRLSAI